MGGRLGAPGHWELELELGGFLLSQAIHSGMPLKENGALVVPSANGYGEAMMFVRCLVSPQCDASFEPRALQTDHGLLSLCIGGP